MTIEEVGHLLPNGFHDSNILRINIDYQKGEVVFLIEVDLSLQDQKVEAPSRLGELKVTRLLYCVLEPPSFASNYTLGKNMLWITSDSSDFSVLKECPNLSDPMPEVAFRHWFFISSHNCFVYIAGMDASFRWMDT